ncbi:MAG: hypothetical protein SAL07_08845 [Oscillatoria sp. PMC 1051.18]|uniref:hypothetical protein n=1 Tax=Oscillatoria salina TaxID=331517 RepID=UPI0013B84A76|nr:hypothetical protein [Oscillatoria salina]MBZ8179167.1 hypothetical protein [Oscillatoria salina IIICB1]MEC5030006.1 hypothetical protein [Oscillatoria sp. PMC 1051.18]NET88048.1 hypothetical protein [Kamptonema sp. SIO1D9]
MNCPFCSGKMLKHIRSNNLYWFCSDCRQELPIQNKQLRCVCLSAKSLTET